MPKGRRSACFPRESILPFPRFARSFGWAPLFILTRSFDFGYAYAQDDKGGWAALVNCVREPRPPRAAGRCPTSASPTICGFPQAGAFRKVSPLTLLTQDDRGAAGEGIFLHLQIALHIWRNERHFKAPPQLLRRGESSVFILLFAEL